MSSDAAADVLLVFPPYWDTASPYLSVPTLAAFLRTRGICVEAIDLNISCARTLLTPQALRDSLNAAKRVLRAWPARGSAVERHDFEENLALCERVWEVAGPNLLAPFAVDAPFPQTVDDYTAFRRKMTWAFTIASVPFYPVRLNTQGLVGTDALERLSAVCDLVDAGTCAPGLDVVKTFAQDRARQPPRLLGISVAGPSQLVPGLLLAKCLKARSPETFVCVGGPQIPYIEGALRRYDRPFDWVDAFVAGEGELPLTDLCLALERGAAPLSVPGLLMRGSSGVVHTGRPQRVELGSLPPPDFTGFEPRHYLGNTGCLPLSFSRGCSWNRCTFCTQHICFDGYRAMDAAQVARHVAYTVQRHPITTIAVNDENLTPHRLLEVGDAVRTHAPGVRWQALARLTPRLADPELARGLADRGCVMLSMGLESAEQEVLDLNQKGIYAKHVPEILRALHNAGIWLNVFLIFGLPGETPETAIETIDFIARNRQTVDSFSPTVFRLEKDSPIAANPQDFGIEPGPVPPDHCDSELPVQTTRWLTKPEAMVCLETLINELVGTPQCPVEQADLNGQFVLQMLQIMGVPSLRRDMERRAEASRDASALLEQDTGGAYKDWWASLHLGEPDAEPADMRIVLALPDRGTFFTLTRQELLLLHLRSLGLPMDSILRSFGSLFEDEVEKAGMGWGITASILLLLSARLFQEGRDKLRVMRVDGPGEALEH
jgi:anaerobic magnesium-protoporphyrin IX monomethyl ester cyclase